MAQKSKGMRRKTRQKLSKKGRNRGRIAKQLQTFEEGDRVVLDIDPAVHSGMPHPRFHARVGTVEEQRGDAYVVTVPDGGKEKQFTVNPAHLTEVKE